MQKLTLLVAVLLLAVVASMALAEEKPTPMIALAKALPELPATAAAAPDADAAATIVRDAARSRMGPLTNEQVVVALIALSDAAGEKDRYTDALRLGQFALTITAASRLGPGLMFDSLSRTGGARYNLDDYSGAAADLDGARKAAAEIAPFDANSVANATANYAVVLDEAGRYREAEAGLREAIALRARAEEQRPASIAIAWSALAAVHKRMGRHDLSEQDYRMALSLLEDAKQTNSNAYGMVLHNYGVLMGETGRDADAAAMYRRAIELRPADARYAPSMINNYTSLVAALIGLNDLDAAEEAVRDAEKAAAGKKKPDSATINVASARANLAGRRGDLAGAEAAADSAVVQARQVVAPNSIRLADVLTTLADARRRNGKPAESLAAIDEAMSISTTLPDRNPLKALAADTRAAVLIDAHDPLRALAASRTAAEIQARRFADEAGLTPAPLQLEERSIIQRRLALLWDASQR